MTPINHRGWFFFWSGFVGGSSHFFPPFAANFGPSHSRRRSTGLCRPPPAVSSCLRARGRHVCFVAHPPNAARSRGGWQGTPCKVSVCLLFLSIFLTQENCTLIAADATDPVGYIGIILVGVHELKSRAMHTSTHICIYYYIVVCVYVYI